MKFIKYIIKINVNFKSNFLTELNKTNTIKVKLYILTNRKLKQTQTFECIGNFAFYFRIYILFM